MNTAEISAEDKSMLELTQAMLEASNGHNVMVIVGSAINVINNVSTKPDAMKATAGYLRTFADILDGKAGEILATEPVAMPVEAPRIHLLN